MPLVVTEIGQKDCQRDFVDFVMDRLDARQIGYLAWSWNAFGACAPGDDSLAWSLVRDYRSAAPNSDHAQADRLLFGE